MRTVSIEQVQVDGVCKLQEENADEWWELVDVIEKHSISFKNQED